MYASYNFAEPLLFDYEIKQTNQRNNKQTKKLKQLAKQNYPKKGASTSTSSILPTKEIMVEQEGGPEVVNGVPYRNSPRRLAQLTNTPNNRQAEMKMGLSQIIYANPFTGLDHEDPYTHVTKFYKLADTMGAPEVEKEAIFMRLFPHSLTVKANDRYLDQPTQIMTN